MFTTKDDPKALEHGFGTFASKVLQTGHHLAARLTPRRGVQPRYFQGCFSPLTRAEGSACKVFNMKADFRGGWL